MRAFVALLSATCALAGWGCSPKFDRADFEPLTDPPVEAHFTWDNGEISEGIALEFRVRPVPDDSHDDDKFNIELSSTDSKVVGVSPGSEDRTWVIFGISPGSASVLVNVDQSLKKAIPVTVLEQK